MKKSQLFNDKIYAIIEMAPFYVFYGDPSQIIWLKQEAKRNRISISIDAAGSLVLPPKNSNISENGKNSHIFLYAMMAKTSYTSVPISQMLSQQHSLNFISFWLRTWLQMAVKPEEEVVDDSAALIGALVKAFTDAPNTKQYIKRCFDLLNQKPVNYLECYIRLDRSHFIKTINKNKMLNTEDSRKGKLFKSVIGFLIQCESFLIAKLVIKELFNLILNQFDGDSTPAEV